MKIMIEFENRVVTIEAPYKCTLTHVVEQLVRPALLALLFSEGSVDKAIGEPDEEGFS